MNKKVVVTGMGVISPIGNSLTEFTTSLKTGVCGIDKITLFDTTDFDVKIAAEVKDFDASKWMEKKDARKMARFTQFAVAAVAQAIDQAGLLKPKAADAEASARAELSCDPERVGVVIGNAIGGYEIVDESYRKLIANGPRRMLPLTVPLIIGNEAAGNISMVYGTKGPALTQVTACASGTDALGEALDLIRAGRCDVVFAGGTEAAISPFSVGGFQMLKALSTKRSDDPKHASRPFDADRDGFVMG
ncbi:MAG: beta-ketoacyl synthase N-terminal-like domain-containing protein, partial [Treponemataceae bacterium]